MPCKTHTPSPESHLFLAEVLKKGGLVGVPTETVYGLAAHALNPEAARQIFSVKGRPLIDPLIVHIHNLEQVDSLAKLNPRAKLIAERFWPGPITIILPKKDIVPSLVTAELDTVAIRMPAHPVFRELLKTCDLPLAAPSANPFGYISPSTAQHVVEHLQERLEHVLDGGPCEHGVESTIVDLSSEEVKVLRPGPISAQEIEDCLNENVTVNLQHHDPKDQKAQTSAGQLYRHYSPKTPARQQEKLSDLPDHPCAIVYLKRPSRDVEQSQSQLGHQVFWLSESGTVPEMLKNLYAMLHRLDKGGHRQIIFEQAPPDEAYLTLNDRLKRACAE